MKKKIFGGIAIIIAAMLMSCSTMPKEEINKTDATIDTAKMAEADIYLPDEFSALTTSMSEIKEKINKNEIEKEEAIKKLEEISKLANQVKENTLIKKAMIKEEIKISTEEIKNIMEESKSLISSVTLRDSTLSEEINAIETSISESSALYDKGEFLASLEKINTNKERAININNQLKKIETKSIKEKNKKA